MTTDRKDAVVNFRLDPDLHDRLKKASQKTGLNVSALSRLLLEQYLEHIETENGPIVMPPTFVKYDVRPRELLKVAEKTSEYHAGKRK